jgi:transposase-like protein
VIDSESASSAPAGYRFPREVIAVSVRWYLRYGLSYRDVEELLAERGIEVDHVTVDRWCRPSRRSSSTRPAMLGTRPVAGGSSMRPT